MENTKYSVLMSVYEKEKPSYFRESIESMLRQTVKPDEIVIVKDGPLTPELEEVISYYIEEHPSIFNIVPLEKNVGLGPALNEGLKKCKNNLVTRMDTDDISLEERCERQLEEFKKNPDLSIVGTWTNEFYDEPSNIVTSRVVPTEHEDIIKFSRRRSPFNHPTVMYKKTAVLGCGGYQDVPRKEDIDLFVRMLHAGSVSKNIPEPLLLFRSNKDSYKRRKTWTNCKSYIAVIYRFWRKGYSSLLDLIIVTIGQVFIFLSPLWFLEKVSDNILRRKIK